MKYYIEAIKNYAVFEGRTTRKEFWMFVLFNLLIALSIGFVTSLALVWAEVSDAQFDTIYDTVTNIYVLFILLPSISITVRRLHDIGRSGWYCLLTFIPFVGVVTIIVIGVISSEPFPNEYGLSAKIIDVDFEEIVTEDDLID